MTKRAVYPIAAERRQILEAALSVITDRGARGFALKDVARRAHMELETLQQQFATLEELILAIALEGFAELAVETEKAIAAENSTLERLYSTAVCYVSFALHHPAHFAVMYEMPLALQEQRPNEPSDLNALGLLMALIDQGQKQGVLPAGDRNEIMLSCWASVHGLAKLATAGTLRMPESVLLAETRRQAIQLIRGMQAR